MLKPKLIIFDLAGTTVDDSAEIPLHAFMEAFADERINISEAEGRKVMGMGKLDSIRLILANRDQSNEELARKVYGNFQQHVQRLLRQGVKPIAGAEKTMRWLKEQDILLATTTGYSQAEEEIVLGQLGWADNGLLNAHVNTSDVAKGRPAPDMIQAVLNILNLSGVNLNAVWKVWKVGDTVADVQEGQNAGVRTVAVLSGTGTREDFEGMSLPPDAIIKDITLLPSLIN